MQKKIKEIRHFFYTQAFADGLRSTIAILSPALVGAYFHQLDLGFTIALGAMCVSLTDAPGPVVHKKNGMLFCTAFIFVTAILTTLARQNLYTMGLTIAAVCFFFSMFTVYGNRATSVGNAAILIMILTMDKEVTVPQALPHALFIVAGGLFYTGVSLLSHTIRPYRIAQRTLGECLREMAAYLLIKADFYNSATPIEENYRRMIAQQVVVNDKQDAVREISFKTRQILKETTTEGKRLVYTFVRAVDLFEDITAAYYDYALLRSQYSNTGALDAIGSVISKMAFELDSIGIAIQANTSFTKTFDYDQTVKDLKATIDGVAKQEGVNTLLLRKILVNIRKMLNGFNDVLEYFDETAERKRSRVDHSHFISHQSLSPLVLWNNLSFSSSVFRHAIRVSLACIIGFIITKWMDYGHHSYWVLLTIAFILKPAFSLTKQRNIQRVIGTLAGGAIGVLVLLFIPNKNVQFILMVLFMLGTYSFMRINYLWMVICTTPYVLILFSFFGVAFRVVASERILDTVIGCAIAFTASYTLFPRWESEQLKLYMQEIINANAGYLQKIVEALSGQRLSILDYKLARKNVYVNSANLSAAFQRMLSEPKSKQAGEKQVHQFVVLNHILFSNIATVATTLLAREAPTNSHVLAALAKRALHHLVETSRKLNSHAEPVAKPDAVPLPETPLSADDLLMKEQLEFINKVCADIEKSTKTAAA